MVNLERVECFRERSRGVGREGGGVVVVSGCGSGMIC